MRYTADKEKDMQRLLMMRDMIAEQELQNVHCPLLLSQLTELEVLANKLIELILEVKQDCEES